MSDDLLLSSGLDFYAIAHDDELMFSCEAPSPIDAMLLMIEQLYVSAIDEVGERYPEVNQWVSDKLGLLNDYKVFELLVDRNKFIDLLEAKNLSDLKPFIELCEFT